MLLGPQRRHVDLQTHEWDFLAEYYNALDAIGHKFMPFHAPRLPHVEEREFEI